MDFIRGQNTPSVLFLKFQNVISGTQFFKICFCSVLLHNKSLMTGPLGNSKFCFPQISMFPSIFSGIRIDCSPLWHYSRLFPRPVKNKNRDNWVLTLFPLVSLLLLKHLVNKINTAKKWNHNPLAVRRLYQICHVYITFFLSLLVCMLNSFISSAFNATMVFSRDFVTSLECVTDFDFLIKTVMLSSSACESVHK